MTLNIIYEGIEYSLTTGFGKVWIDIINVKRSTITHNGLKKRNSNVYYNFVKSVIEYHESLGLKRVGMDIFIPHVMMVGEALNHPDHAIVRLVEVIKNMMALSVELGGSSVQKVYGKTPKL